MTCKAAIDTTKVTWVLNTETGATSQYDSFGFNSYAQTATETLAAAEDGIYVLDGISDMDVPAFYTVELPLRDFGVSMKKRVPYIWATIASYDFVSLSVSVEGEVYNYAANNYSQNLMAQRYDIGRGLEGVFWSVAFKDSVPFELESVRFDPLVLNRRT